MTNALTKAHINIRAISSFDNPEFSILRLVVDRAEEAKAYLTSQGFVVRIHPVVGVELVDQKGNLNNMLKILADAQISINYIYSFVIREEKTPVMVFSTDDLEDAVRILEEANVKIVDDSEL